MGRNGLVSVLFVFLLINDVSGISFDRNTRKLAASVPATNSAPAQVPPLLNPVPGAEKPDSTTSDKSSGNSPKDVANDPPSSDTVAPNVTALIGPPTSDETNNKTNSEKKDNETKSSQPQGEESNKKPSPPQGQDTKKNPSPPQGKEEENKLSPPKVETHETPSRPSEPNETDKKQSPPVAKHMDKERNPPPETKATDKKLSPPTGVLESCNGKEKKCQVENTFTGCIRNFNPDSKELEILVQNDGQEDLMVNFIVPTSEKDNKKDVPVPKHQITKVNISNIIGKASKIVLKTGNKECDIDIGSPLPEGSVLFHLPTTAELLTPINGAYFLMVTVITFGGVWACCKFTKRRRHGSVPYQELEMASPETASAAVETAEGWDRGWDDDWDEENSVKSPVVRVHTGNISANGLTSRPANRDGWDNDWDD